MPTAHNLDDHISNIMINLFSEDIDRIGWNVSSPIEMISIENKIFYKVYEMNYFYAFHSKIEFQSENVNRMKIFNQIFRKYLIT